MTDPVNHPHHYGGADNPFEAIKVIEAWGLGFNLGNTVKYISRAEHKGAALEDIKKARWYLDHEIVRREGALRAPTDAGRSETDPASLVPPSEAIRWVATKADRSGTSVASTQSRHELNVHIHSKPYRQLRYETYGDYESFADGSLEITVVQLPDWRYESLIALHELVEEMVTRARGITEPEILAFDLAHLELADPGMDTRAPYHKEHVLATAIEMIVAQALGVDWAAYERACEEASREENT